MNNWTMIGRDVLYFSTSHGSDGEFPLQPRAAKITGFQGGDRYSITVFNDTNRNFSAQPAQAVRAVRLCKPGESGNEPHWICDPKDMPADGDWTLPPTIAKAPGDMAKAAKAKAKLAPV
jgi:hypothetical protein